MCSQYINTQSDNPLLLQMFTTKQPYEEIYTLQKDVVAQRITGACTDTLLLGEHPPVVTLGRGTKPVNILDSSIKQVAIERGGDVTYHGPGQLVVYPILELHAQERNLHAYLRRLEAVLMATLDHYGIEGTRKAGWTGVWVGEQKIASIGVAVRKWVTYHGFALNVTTDLTAFETMNPCGLPSTVMTSMQTLLGTAFCPNVEQLIPTIAAVFSAEFNRTMV